MKIGERATALLRKPGDVVRLAVEQHFHPLAGLPDRPVERGLPLGTQRHGQLDRAVLFYAVFRERGVVFTDSPDSGRAGHLRVF